MKRIEISGGKALYGTVSIQGSKNAVLPMIAAAILTDEKVTITNCPHIDDVYTMLNLMTEIGWHIRFENHILEIWSDSDINPRIRQDKAGKVRSSITLLGSLLGRCKMASLPYPGGCTIGARPIDLHIEMLGKMGVIFENDEDFLTASAKKLSGTKIKFYKKSVGAAQNCIMAAVLADGITRIKGLSLEPEVMELCSFLRKMGAVILRTDYDEIMIKGVERLHSVTYNVVADRIVAGTYMIAAAATRGRVFLKKAPANHLHSVIECLRVAGAYIKCDKSGIYVDGTNAGLPVSYISTANYPGFPTDLQSQLVAALTVCEGKCIVEEKIFESRFKAALELKKMNADVIIKDNKIIINPVKNLCGADVSAQELRGGAALVIAGLMAQGNTTISGCNYINRGYEDIVRDFVQLGADIKITGE